MKSKLHPTLFTNLQPNGLGRWGEGREVLQRYRLDKLIGSVSESESGLTVLASAAHIPRAALQSNTLWVVKTITIYSLTNPELTSSI